MCSVSSLILAALTLSIFEKVLAVHQKVPTLNVQLPAISGNTFGVLGINATFDYVVVGGGTAGLTIASRLAEKYSVAVIEAGGFYEIDNGNGSIVPALSTSQYVGPSPDDVQPLIDWGFSTTPQEGADGRKILYPRGKTLGGSSARHYMGYHRPTVGSMNEWADQVGDQSFAWDNVYPYFQKSGYLTSANSTVRFANSSTQYSFTDAFNASAPGPLAVTWPNYALPLYSWAAAGMAAVGLPVSNQSFLGGILSGVGGWVTSTIDPPTQQRASSETSFLRQAMLDTDIKVYTQTLAEEILFDLNQSATGVRVTTAGKTFVLSAKNEVILSAGAFQSPQLLMVSGIGPKAMLEEHNITVRRDAPGVGQNMQDHVLSGAGYRVKVPTMSSFLDPIYAARVAEEYIVNQTGPLTAPPGYLAWERLQSVGNLTNYTLESLAKYPSDWPQIEYIANSALYTSADPDDGYQYASIVSVLVNPFSRGNVSITSANMADAPIINPAWLSDPRDIDMLVSAFRRVRQMWSHMSDVTIGEEYSPGLNVTTDEQIADFYRQTMGPLYHASATCKMGPMNDTMAVVDSRARVYGVANLRVVDTSAFPFLTPGHPQSVAYMLAEKIADDVMYG